MGAISVPTPVVVFLAVAALCLLVALIRYAINHHKHHIDVMKGNPHGGANVVRAVVDEPEEVVEGETEDEEEDDDENCVFDITDSDDEDLELADGEEAILMFFFYNRNEVCDKQWSAVNSLSNKWEDKVRFVSIDSTHPDTAPLAAFHGIHNAPAFVLRRRNDVAYHKVLGLQDKTQLDAFIVQGLATEPALPQS